MLRSVVVVSQDSSDINMLTLNNSHLLEQVTFLVPPLKHKNFEKYPKDLLIPANTDKHIDGMYLKILNEIRKSATDYIFLFETCKKYSSCLLWYDPFGFTLLHHAIVSKGDPRAVSCIIRANPQCIQIPIRDTDTLPIHQAVLAGRLDIIRLIIKYDTFETRFIPCKGQMPHHMAIYQNRVDVAKYLLQLDPITVSENKHPIEMKYLGKNSFLIACMKSPGLVPWMLMAFPRQYTIDTTDVQGNSAVHITAARGDMPTLKCILQSAMQGHELENKSAKRLLEAQVNMFRAQNIAECTPFFLACMAGHVEMVDFMLGIDDSLMKIHATRKTFPIHIACQMRRFDVVKVLLKYDRTCASWQRQGGQLPLGVVLMPNNESLHEKLITELVKAYPEATLYVSQNKAETPLQLVQKMVRRDIQLQNENKKTLLNITNGNVERLLLRTAMNIERFYSEAQICLSLKKSSELRSQFMKQYRDSNWQWRGYAVLLGSLHKDKQYGNLTDVKDIAQAISNGLTISKKRKQDEMENGKEIKINLLAALALKSFDVFRHTITYL